VSVAAAVQRDLDAIAERDAVLACSGLAMLALSLAAEIDDSGNSATSKAACARALAEALGTLRELMPPRSESDAIDELGSRRSKRLA
jgi:hypothetical protein